MSDFCILLTIIFTLLKLSGVIFWSWLWVLSPIWIPMAAGVVLGLIMLIFVFLEYISD